MWQNLKNFFDLRTIVSLLIVGLFTFVTSALFIERAGVLASVEWVEKHRQTWTRIEPLIFDLVRSVRSSRGRAAIEDVTVGSSVRINVNSDAAKFFVLSERRTMFLVRAVNLSHPLKPDAQLMVVGSYDEPEGQTLARLSRTAAQQLEAGDASEITVILEYLEPDAARP